MSQEVKRYLLNDVVDIYVKDLPGDIIYVQFYFINTRRKLGVSADSAVLEVIKEFSSEISLDDINRKYSDEYSIEGLAEFLEFLLTNQVIIALGDEKPVPSFLDKEALFVKEWIGGEPLTWPLDKKVLIVGCGAVGGAVAEILVRGGVNHLGLLDFKLLEQSGRERHVHYQASMLGYPKTEVLKCYLERLREGLSISVMNVNITPKTEMSCVFNQDYDLIVNTADEPYIGYTSILLGRWARVNNIPLYVAGGFDAHLFSTGDFYDISQGYCVECTAEFFSESLRNWKPTYFVPEVKDDENAFLSRRIVGGSGGHMAGSLFSASYSAMSILNFLHGGSQWRKNSNRRGEYDNVSGMINWVNISPVSKCTHHD